ncbi:MAG: hypothetical protein Q9167_005633 [Letrouitia subvulpina]
MKLLLDASEQIEFGQAQQELGRIIRQKPFSYKQAILPKDIKELLRSVTGPLKTQRDSIETPSQRNDYDKEHTTFQMASEENAVSLNLLTKDQPNKSDQSLQLQSVQISLSPHDVLVYEQDGWDGGEALRSTPVNKYSKRKCRSTSDKPVYYPSGKRRRRTSVEALPREAEDQVPYPETFRHQQHRLEDKSLGIDHGLSLSKPYHISISSSLPLPPLFTPPDNDSNPEPTKIWRLDENEWGTDGTNEEETETLVVGLKRKGLFTDQKVTSRLSVVAEESIQSDLTIQSASDYPTSTQLQRLVEKLKDSPIQVGSARAVIEMDDVSALACGQMLSDRILMALLGLLEIGNCMLVDCLEVTNPEPKDAVSDTRRNRALAAPPIILPYFRNHHFTVFIYRPQSHLLEFFDSKMNMSFKDEAKKVCSQFLTWLYSAEMLFECPETTKSA